MKKFAFVMLLSGFVVNLMGQPAGFNYTANSCAGTNSLGMLGTIQINGVLPGPGSWIAAFDQTDVLCGSSQLDFSGMAANIQANQVNTDLDNPVGPPLNCDVVDAGIDGYPGSPEQFYVVVWNSTDSKYYQFPNVTTRTYFDYVPDGTLGIYIQAFSNYTTNWSFTGIGYDNLTDLFNMVLPVELVRFEGKKQDKVISLYWSTAAEINNSHFDIEQSVDGRVFKKIGEMKGAGTSSTLSEYSFIDESPNIGLNYYRLKQVDFDGQFEYSKVITVNFDRKNSDDLEVFPNPTSAFADILLPESLTDRETVITLHDFAGREVLRRKEQPSNSVRLELEGLPAGYYTINVRSGNETFIKPLVIQ